MEEGQTVLNEKQLRIFKELETIKDVNVEVALIKLSSNKHKNINDPDGNYEKLRKVIVTEEDLSALKNIMNEVTETTIYNILEMIDGYRNIGFELDIVDKNSKESLKNTIQLHDKFMDFIQRIYE